MKRQQLHLAATTILLVVAALVVTPGISCPAQSPNSNSPTLYFFTSDGCPPCRQVEPVLMDLAKQGYPIVKVNTNRFPDWANRFSVRCTPTVVLASSNHEYVRHSGLIDKQTLVGWFQQVQVQPSTANSRPPGKRFAESGSAATSATNLDFKRRISDPNQPTMHKGTRIPATDVEQRAISIACFAWLTGSAKLLPTAMYAVIMT